MNAGLMLHSRAALLRNEAEKSPARTPRQGRLSSYLFRLHRPRRRKGIRLRRHRHLRRLAERRYVERLAAPPMLRARRLLAAHHLEMEHAPARLPNVARERLTASQPFAPGAPSRTARERAMAPRENAYSQPFTPGVRRSFSNVWPLSGGPSFSTETSYRPAA